jgi:hypothetical protein
LSSGQREGRRVAWVGIAAHIARLRAVVGHELLLLPSVPPARDDLQARLDAVLAEQDDRAKLTAP